MYYNKLPHKLHNEKVNSFKIRLQKWLMQQTIDLGDKSTLIMYHNVNLHINSCLLFSIFL